MPDYTDQQLRAFMEQKLAEGVPKEDIFAFLDEMQGPQVSQFEGAMPGEPPLITAAQPASTPAPPKAGFMSRTWDEAKGLASDVGTLAKAATFDRDAIHDVAEGVASTGRDIAQDYRTKNPVKATIHAAGRVVGLSPENITQDVNDGNYGAVLGDVLLPGVAGLAPTGPGRAVTRTAGRGIQATARPIAKGVGTAAAKAGSTPFLGAAMGVGAGIASGNLLIGGATAIAAGGARAALKSGGTKLRNWGMAPGEAAHLEVLRKHFKDLDIPAQNKQLGDAKRAAKTPERLKTIAAFEDELIETRARTPDPAKVAIDKAIAEREAAALLERDAAKATKKQNDQIQQWRDDAHTVAESERMMRQAEGRAMPKGDPEVAVRQARKAMADDVLLEAEAAQIARKNREAQAAKEGLEPGPRAMRESSSVETPSGQRVSTSQTFKAADEADTGLPPGGMTDQLSQMSPEAQARVRAQLTGGSSRPVPSVRPIAPAVRPPAVTRTAQPLSGKKTPVRDYPSQNKAALRDREPLTLADVDYLSERWKLNRSVLESMRGKTLDTLKLDDAIMDDLLKVRMERHGVHYDNAADAARADRGDY